MYTFKDYYNNEVKLSFDDHPFSLEPKHVWVVCRHKDKWLLTKHKGRGYEFPGGNVEEGENAKEAAIREVKEETGGNVEKIYYIGQYNVTGRNETVIKNVYFAKINQLIQQDTYYETEGPLLLKKIPSNVRYNQLYSFIMKDGVLDYCMKQIRKTRLLARA